MTPSKLYETPPQAATSLTLDTGTKITETSPVLGSFRVGDKVSSAHGYEGTIIHRGRPRLEERANTIEAQKPWLKIVDALTGKPLSRSQWYARKKEMNNGR
jgi:hypothetical protein